jgi:cyclophilin family peptidyl-prolyl cis-trans isomerase
MGTMVIRFDNGRPRVKGEFNSHPFVVGTVGLARDVDPDSGGTEVFICLAPRPHLDGKYAAFGELIEGRDVLEKIGAVAVNEKWIESGGNKVAFHEPKTPVVIEKATIEKRPVPVKPQA